MSHPSADAARLPFPEQIAFFRNKLGNLVPTQRWDDLQGAAHDDGFMVAGAMSADLLADLAAAVDKAIAEGRGVEEFRRDFRAIAARNGWTGWTGEGSVKGEAWRVRTILRTNAYTSYAAGRFAQLKAEGYAFWVYRHGDSREPRFQHLSWNGMVLPPEHAFWATHYPPSDWGCSCYVTGASSEAMAKRLGGDPGKVLPDGWQKTDPKTGAPVGIGKGWGYAPGASVADRVQIMAEKMRQWPAEIGAGYGQSIARQIDEAWAVWVEETLSGTNHKPGFLGTMDAADIAELGKRDIAPASADIWVNPGLVKGPKADRHTAKGDALDKDIIASLSALYRDPLAVLLDEKTGNLIYVLKAARGAPQLVVRLDYWLVQDRQGQKTNAVVSLYDIQIADLRARLKGGLVSLLRGELR